ncbi:MAG: FtsX-like permease family protein, partial [Acidimicrobiales bacterium]
MGARAGARAAGRLYAGRLLRRRLLSIGALGLLGAIGLAIAASAVAGARRSETAYSRLSEATLAADAVVFASQVGIGDADWSAVADLPYVAAAGAFGLPDGRFIDGPDGVDIDALGVFSTSFGDWRTSVDRPVLIEGRYPDQSRPDEVLASAAAANLGVEVGDQFVGRLNTPEQSAVGTGDAPEGPTVTLTVTGIGKSTVEAAIFGGPGDLFFTRAFDEQYGDGITFVSNLMVRFAEGEHDVARLEDDARRLLGAGTLPVLDAEAVGKRVTNGTDLEANGLWLFAVAVAAATVALVGQALSRAVRSVSAEAAMLRALGMSRAGTAAVLALPFGVAIVIASAAGTLGAIALSPRFPIGLAREIDPDPGLHADWTVLGAGSALTVAAFGAITWWTAWREAGGRQATAIARTSRIAASLARAGVPLPVSLGARLALE